MALKETYKIIYQQRRYDNLALIDTSKLQNFNFRNFEALLIYVIHNMAKLYQALIKFLSDGARGSRDAFERSQNFEARFRGGAISAAYFEIFFRTVLRGLDMSLMAENLPKSEFYVTFQAFNETIILSIQKINLKGQELSSVFLAKFSTIFSPTYCRNFEFKPIPL